MMKMAKTQKDKFVIKVYLIDSETRERYTRYITRTEYTNWYADLGETAKEFDLYWAKDIAMGLALNFTKAEVVLKQDWYDYVNPTKEQIEKGEDTRW